MAGLPGDARAAPSEPAGSAADALGERTATAGHRATVRAASTAVAEAAAGASARLADDDSVREIIHTVLDAADVEILEDLAAGAAGRAARVEAENGVLLQKLMADVLRRYYERQRRQARGGAA